MALRSTAIALFSLNQRLVNYNRETNVVFTAARSCKEQ